MLRRRGAVGLRLNGIVTSRRSNPAQGEISRRIAGAMRAHARTLPSDIDLASLWAGLRRRLPWVLALTAGAGLATFVALSLVAPRYTSEAQLAIIPMTTGAIPAGADHAPPDDVASRSDAEAIRAHVRALTGTDLVRQVIGELQLGRGRELNVGPGHLNLFNAVLRLLGLADPPAGDSEEDGLLSDAKRRLDVTAQDGRFFSIRFTSSDPQLAADFANKLAETYHSRLVSGPVRGGANAAPMAAHIASRARPASVPSSPRRGPYALVAMAAAWLLGIGWVLTREFLAARPASDTPRRRDSEPLAQPTPARALSDADPGAVWLDAAQDAWFHKVWTIIQVAERLLARSDLQSGVRSLVAGERPENVASEALALVKALARAGRQVVLIEWSPAGRSRFADLPLRPTPGMTDLLEGRASFEDVIARLPGSQAHFVSAGAGLADPAAALDPNGINMVLDALDEVYDQIVIAAGNKDARALFAALEGRFDAGIVVAGGGHRPPDGQAGPGRFLGFDVIDIDIIRYERSGLAAAPPWRFQLPRARRAA